MIEKRLTITEGLRKILDYPKFVGPTRMLILETQYFFDQSWLRAAQSLGWETATVPSVMTGGLTRDQVAQLFQVIGSFKPHFILTSNYAGMDVDGIFARFFEDARIPYVSWFTDTPRMILFARTVHCSPYSVAATWERAYIPHLEALGFEQVVFMPHATDPHLFIGEVQMSFPRQLAFVGVSMTDLAQEAFDKLAPRPDLIEAITRAFQEGRVTRESFAHGIDTIIPKALLEKGDDTDRRNAELCLVYEGTRRLRTSMVRRLIPLGIEVFGDAAWQSILAKGYGDVGYFDDLAPFYRSTAINLNSTSLQMRTSVNQRVFDCPAAGGFLITDAQADLGEFFDLEREVVTYAELDELVDKIEFYRVRPEARAEMVRAAQKRIAAQHTHAHRLATLEQHLRNRFAG
ncbi:MAG: glycosyltransferase [Candidatus Hydrogenedentes bacterium]|nr:glycosyltransferase [Candidatus Hydrogenedentota bacterium]